MSSELGDDHARRLGGDPLRHSRRLSDDLVEDARKIFQKRTDRKLSDEDARQMLENLIGFFSVLNEWDRAGPPCKTRHGSYEDDRDDLH